MGRLEAQYRDRALGGRLDDAPSVELRNLFGRRRRRCELCTRALRIGAEFSRASSMATMPDFMSNTPGPVTRVAIDHEG